MARVREFDTHAALEAALAAFRRKGYEGTSVQDLVDATGVGRGSLYAAFGSKNELYHAAMHHYRKHYAMPITEALRCDAPPRELLRGILVSLVDDIVKDETRQACLIVSASTERVPHDLQLAREIQETIESIEDALTEVIATGQRNGDVTSEQPARSIARFLITAMQGIRVMGAINPDRSSLMPIADVALTTLD
ncbi:TetR/AcrR family transcriptional regulator [Streptomyces sp. NPDC056909]|uniref:TetR/AcrR family transcriptional regulator n=1 Tax=unclassified Streptomyces TaxID=2593676 RepID=UPI00368D5AEB|nr:TetR/AcrR family transcriptional regulator [Streptomyces sp. NBC_00872]